MEGARLPLGLVIAAPLRVERPGSKKRGSGWMRLRRRLTTILTTSRPQKGEVGSFPAGPVHQSRGGGPASRWDGPPSALRVERAATNFEQPRPRLLKLRNDRVHEGWSETLVFNRATNYQVPGYLVPGTGYCHHFVPTPGPTRYLVPVPGTLVPLA